MARPARRNALSREHLTQLLAAVTEAGRERRAGIVLAAEGPVFSAGHDFADVAGRGAVGVRSLLALCTELMQTIQAVPQVVIARVHGLATAAGCQLVASCDLAVAAESAGFARPAGRAAGSATPRGADRPGHRPQATDGDGSDRRRHRRRTALDWGLVNRVVPDDELDAAVADLLARATRGTRASKALGKQTLYAQLDRPERDAYAVAVEVMAAASQTARAPGRAWPHSWRSAVRSGRTDGRGPGGRPPVHAGYGVLPADQGSGLMLWAEAERRLTCPTTTGARRFAPTAGRT